MTLLCDRVGERADAAIARLAPEITRSAAQRLLAGGCVLRGGVPLKKSDAVNPGDRLELTLPEAAPAGVEAQDIPLDVRYEDSDLVVINKPRGLVVHPAPGHEDGTLVNALLHHCGQSLSGVGGELRPGIVHRIDKDTSGLLIVAKNDFAHNALSAQLQDHSLHRVYEAIVRGNLRQDSGTVSAPIGRHPADRKRMAVVAGGREATTHYTVLARWAGTAQQPAYTRLQLQLETGRTHQIRVHMAYLGHPVVGDPVYGSKKPELGQTAQVLHARELVFRHPRSGELVRVQCELPDYFLEVLRRLGEPET